MMAEDIKTPEEMQNDLDEMARLLSSPDWKHFTKFLKESRRPSLQNTVNQFVKQGDLQKAQIAYAVFEDCDKLIELFKAHVKDLGNKQKGAK